MEIKFFCLIFLISIFNSNCLKIPQPIFNYQNQIGERSFKELITNINSNSIDKLWISNDGNEIISVDNSVDKTIENLHHTWIEPNVVSNIIDKTVEHNLDLGFYKTINNDIYSSFANDIGFLFNNILVPLLGIMIIINLLRGFSPLRQGNTNLSNQNGFNPFSGFNSKKNTFDATKYNITLASWVGSPEIFEECTEVISYIKNSTNYDIMGAELPKGILLEGPPGTGKTLLAKAIASETNSSFISVSASEFIELFVGMGASRVRDLFNDARQNSPCIIFIDEIDAIGKQRSSGSSFAGNDEREQTLNQLLAEMDGFSDNKDLLVLAATNRKDILDQALLRPGRFDRIIKIGLPDKTSRQQILNYYLDKKKIDDNIDVKSLAELTDGFSGAQLKNLINEAAIFAARLGSTKITRNDISNALEKNIVGLIKNIDTRHIDTKLRISVHEIGHAFLILYFSEYFDLQKVSIKATYNGAGGYTIFNEKQKCIDGGLYTKDILFKRLIISMGGKAAESICYGTEQMSLGATQDLKQANDLARKMIGNFGMGEKLETFYNDNIDQASQYLGDSNNKYSEEIKESFDMETLQLVSKAYEEAKEIISKNINKFNDLVNLLIEKEILYQDDMKSIINN